MLTTAYICYAMVDVQEYLKPTQHIKTDGIVKQFADKIVGTETNPLKKAELIHQWIVNNMERDNSDCCGCVERAVLSSVLQVALSARSIVCIA